MNGSKTIGVALAGVVLVATACGDSAENSLENLLEQETGEDIDLDFGDDGFSIDTGEGSLTVDEDGNFVVVDDSGEVITGQVSEEDGGFSIESDEGSFTVDEEGNFVVEGEDGEVITGNAGNGSETGGEANAELDDDGSFTITNEDGDVTFSGGTEFPDEWPADVPRPEGIDVTSSSVLSGQPSLVIVAGTVDGSANDYINGYGAMLESAGFSRLAFFEDAGNISAIWENDAYQVTVGSFDSEVTVSASSKT